MADMAENLLQIVADRESFDTLALSQELGVDHQKIVGAIKSLQSHGDIISCEQRTDKRWELTAEGNQVADNGSHEAVVYNAIPTEGGITQADLMKTVPNAKIGFSKAMSAGWILIDKKAEGGPRVFRKMDNIEDKVQDMCVMIRNEQMGGMTDQQKAEFKKRKLISEVKINTYHVTKGSNFSTTLKKQETELTPEMLQSGSWKEKSFKPYNFDALGIMPASGHLHPLLKVRTQFRQIFLEMGFSEMPTNNYVESSFWNFDALFQPQQHPARDAHDTFFVSDPAKAHEFPMEYLKKVKEVHSVGGYGSQGYKYDWKLEEGAKNIMRTHTTAVSARMLYKLAQQEIFTPAKYFSIDRVFRNETLDATHLAEFHQIEGLVADYGLTLGDLMGLIQEFFKKLGVPKIRFKPAYNPYTEPSMEIFSYHEGLKKWVEVGNSGVFRPEMLLPMGLPENVSVIAWGLSLERPTMIKYGIDNIRDLFGPKVNLQMIYDNPICILEKHSGPVADAGDSEMCRSAESYQKTSDAPEGIKMDEEGLKALELHLSRASFVRGFQPSQADTAAFNALPSQPNFKLYPHIARWYSHMFSYGKDIAYFPGTPISVTELGFNCSGGSGDNARGVLATKKEDGDDDFDLFGSDDEEDEEVERIKQERLKAYAEKKAKKAVVVAKSGIVLDVKPWDDETDMKKVEECVRSIEADGLLWGASKLIPLAYGIRKLQISCVVEDDKIGTDFLEEEITNFEDYVQSVDIAAFNKI